MASGRGASSRWFFTREQLENTPSRRCGVEADMELSYRQQAANLIQEMGQRLNVYPFLCLALHCSRPVPTPRRVSGPGAPRTWRRSSRAPRPRPKGKAGSGPGGRERREEERSGACGPGAARGGGGGVGVPPGERGIAGVKAGERRLLGPGSGQEGVGRAGSRCRRARLAAAPRVRSSLLRGGVGSSGRTGVPRRPAWFCASARAFRLFDAELGRSCCW